MELCSVQRYVEVSCERGRILMMITLRAEPLKLSGVIIKSVEMETIEMDVLKIDGKYYEIIGWYGGLAHIVEVAEEDI